MYQSDVGWPLQLLLLKYTKLGDVHPLQYTLDDGYATFSLRDEDEEVGGSKECDDIRLFLCGSAASREALSILGILESGDSSLHRTTRSEWAAAES